jgi:prepilin-type N-terminal cleavage/methylation domain-containing protein
MMKMQKVRFQLVNPGFTLIELLVTMAIISILAVISIPFYSEALDKAREGTTEATISYVAKALVVYQSDRGIFPVTGEIEQVKQALEKGGYLTKMPISDSFGSPFRYFSFDGVNLYIFSDGIDKKPNTMDDIVFKNGVFIQDGIYKN